MACEWCESLQRNAIFCNVRNNWRINVIISSDNCSKRKGNRPFRVLQKVFSLKDIRTHLDLEPCAGMVQAGQKAPVYILRNSAVCVYCPVLIYGAQRALEPGGCHCWPPTINLNHTDMASFGQEQENLPPPHPALRYMWTSATFYSLSII